MGQSIALGDFNHDGIQDIVMGGYNRLNAGVGNTITRVFVFLGTGNSPSSGLPVFRHRVTISGTGIASQPQTLDLFGFAVAFIGDINSDGCDEVVVGSPRFDAPGMTDSGRVSIFFGRPDVTPIEAPPVELLAVSDENLSFNGTIDGGWFGASLATARDTSGAFLKDLLIGAPGNSVASTTVAGSVYLYQSPTMIDAGVLGGAVPSVSIGASISLGTAGIAGSVYTGFIATAHRLHQGIAPGDLFGQSVAFVGNLDGLAGQEYLVGAPQYASESGSPTTKGKGYVRLFRMGSSTELITIEGTQGPNPDPRQEGEAFGFSVAGGFNLNPDIDSVPDLLIGAPLFNVDATGPGTGLTKAGRVRAYSGDLAADGVEFPLLDPLDGNGTVMVGNGGSDQFGYSVAGMPDISGDLRPEIIVGAWQGPIASVTICNPQSTLRTALGGYAVLFTSGGSPPGAKLVTFYGEAFRDHLGRAVAVGDLYGSSSSPEIVLSGVAWTPFGQTFPDEVGKGYVWDGDTVLLP